MRFLTSDQVRRVSKITGLKRSTVTDLFERGWVYNELLGRAPQWVKPPNEKASSGSIGRHDAYDPGEYRVALFDTSEEANGVLKDLLFRVQNYTLVTVGYFKSHTGREMTKDDYLWGWRMLSGAYITYTSNGWELHLPPPEKLE